MGKLKKLARCAAVLFSLTLATGCVYYQAQGYNTGDWKPPEERPPGWNSYDAAVQEGQISADTRNRPMMSSSKSFVINSSGLEYSLMPQPQNYGVVDESNPSWVLIEGDSQPVQSAAGLDQYMTKFHLNYGPANGEQPEPPMEPKKKLLISGTKAPFPGVVDGPNPFLKDESPLNRQVQEAPRAAFPWAALKEEDRRRLFMSGSKSSPFRSPPAQSGPSQQK